MATVTHGALSSNNLVNGVLWDGWKWQDGGTPLNITYFFAEDGGVSWTQSAKTALATAFGTYAQVANITFSETAVRADADFVENLLTHAQQLGAVGSHDTPQGAASANTHIHRWYAFFVIGDQPGGRLLHIRLFRLGGTLRLDRRPDPVWRLRRGHHDLRASATRSVSDIPTISSAQLPRFPACRWRHC